MRTLLCGMVAAGLLLCVLGASDAIPAQKKSSPKTAAKRKTNGEAHATASKAATKSGAKPATRRTSAASKRGGKKPVAARTTWRNRQVAPTPDRYREIQQALAAKGYLKPEDVSGGWDQNSIDALKRFQAAQNLDSTGKINALSLIALGLGPKHDTASVRIGTEAGQSAR